MDSNKNAEIPPTTADKMNSNENEEILTIPSDKIGRVVMEESISSSNVRPSVPFDQTITGPLFAPKEPLIERLAEAARPKEEQPTAGSYAIEHVNLDHLPDSPTESLPLEDRPVLKSHKAFLDSEYPLSSIPKELKVPQAPKPSSQSARIDPTDLKDFEIAWELLQDQAALAQLEQQASATPETAKNNEGPEVKSETPTEAESKPTKPSRGKFSVAAVSGFFKRRSTTK